MSIEDCEDIVYGFLRGRILVLKRFLGIYKRFIEDKQRSPVYRCFGRCATLWRKFTARRSRSTAAKPFVPVATILIQSTASDMMLICLFTIETMMRDRQSQLIALVSTVHDSFDH